MTKEIKIKSFSRDILPIILFVAVVAATVVMVFLHSRGEQNTINVKSETSETAQVVINTPKPTATQEPTATPRAIYIPDPDELQEVPAIDTLELLEDNILATEKITLRWDRQEDADYYLLCVLDEDDNIIQKEILWANIVEWEISNFDGARVMLLSYKDMGDDNADDDKLLKSYILDTTPEQEEQPLLDVTPEDRYYILVDKEDFSFAILTLDENMEYTKVVATFPCALGRSSRMTPTGKFEISSKGDWKSWATGDYSPYYTRYTSGLYIHGALYNKKTYDSMIDGYYNRIGTNHTSGCIRTTLEGARWVYYNCPAGTVVKIVSSSDLVEHVEKPEIDPDYPTWDPTDPNKPSD